MKITTNLAYQRRLFSVLALLNREQYISYQAGIKVKYRLFLRFIIFQAILKSKKCNDRYNIMNFNSIGHGFSDIMVITNGKY